MGLAAWLGHLGPTARDSEVGVLEFKELGYVHPGTLEPGVTANGVEELGKTCLRCPLEPGTVLLRYWRLPSSVLGS